MPLLSPKRHLLKRVILTHLVLGCTCTSSYADFFLHSWENHRENKSVLNLGVQIRYYTTSSNFDPAGSVNTPSALQSYMRLQDDINAVYGLTDRLSIYGRLSWVYINQNSSSRPGTGFGLADQTVGANFRFYESSSWNFDAQAQVDFPAYSTARSESAQTPYLGDGSTDFTAGLFTTFFFMKRKTDTLGLVGGAGYTYRTAQFSAAIPWSVLVEYLPTVTGFYVGLGGSGMVSLKNDPNGSSGVPRSSLGSGGSNFIGATNPSLVNLQGQVGYQIDRRIAFNLSFAQSIWGQAAPKAFSGMLGFQARIGHVSQDHENAILQSPNSYAHSNYGFLNYSLDARVLKRNDRLNLVKIDKGRQDGVEVGQIFDVFLLKKDGTAGIAIARGRVSSVKVNEAVIEITEFYQEVWIEEGFFAKRLIQ